MSAGAGRTGPHRLLRRGDMVKRYLIWSFYHGQWWGPARNGYVHSVAIAGQYTAEAAIEILCSDVTRRNLPVRAEEARDDAWPATSPAEEATS